MLIIFLSSPELECVAKTVSKPSENLLPLSVLANFCL